MSKIKRNSCESQKARIAAQSLLMPAEWEPHTATWLAWPHNKKTWPEKFNKIPEVFAEMTKALHQNEKVNILVKDKKMEIGARKSLEKTGVKNLHNSNSNIAFYHIPTNDSWIRDFGPIFVKNAKNKIMIEDWIFNVWGQRWETKRPLDDAVPTKIAKKDGYALIEPGIVLEGGSIDVNGKGTLLTTESCLLSPTRNPHLNKKQIEKYLKDYLGATNVLWLKEGIGGDDTSGHIDDLARFVNENTVICMIEQDKKNENYKNLKENFRRLEKMRDQDGKKLNVIEIPMPKPVPGPKGKGYEDAFAPASYANFYIANNAVLLPIFKDELDDEVVQIFEKFFPARKIVPIDCRDLVWGLGAIHCSTQQQPMRK